MAVLFNQVDPPVDSCRIAELDTCKLHVLSQIDSSAVASLAAKRAVTGYFSDVDLLWVIDCCLTPLTGSLRGRRAERQFDSFLPSLGANATGNLL